MLVTGGLASSSYPATVGNTGSWLVGTSPTLYPPKDAPVEERKYQFQPLKYKAPLAAEWSRPLLQAQGFPVRSQAGTDDWNYGERWRFPIIQLLGRGTPKWWPWRDIHTSHAVSSLSAAAAPPLCSHVAKDSRELGVQLPQVQLLLNPCNISPPPHSS